MTIDIVICTKDRREDLQRCLNSLARQSEPPDRVILVDASVHPIEPDLPFGLSIEFVHTRPGLTHQRNVGLALATAELVAFFDDDMELAGDYLSHVCDWFRSHPACAGVSGNIVNEPRRPTVSKLFRSLFCLANDDGILRPSGDAAYLRHPTRETRVHSLSGGNMIFSQRANRDLRFDEELPLYGGEDVDFSLRASRYGELWMLPYARVVHHQSQTGRMAKRQYVREVITTSAYLFGKHRREFGLRRPAFARRIVGRSIAYLLLSIAYRSPDPVLGLIDGIPQIPSMIARGAKREST